MAEGTLTIDVAAETGWPVLPRPAVERVLPGLGSLWVHSYTPKEFAEFRLIACRMADVRLDKDPPPMALSLAQVACVCRTEEGSSEHVFKLAAQNLPAQYERLAKHLPQPWVEAVCRESDLLGMMGYVPPKPAKGKPQLDAAAVRNLREALADRSLWTALALAYRKLYGANLADSDEHIGEVLTLIAANDEFVSNFVGAFSALGV